MRRARTLLLDRSIDRFARPWQPPPHPHPATHRFIDEGTAAAFLASRQTPPTACGCRRRRRSWLHALLLLRDDASKQASSLPDLDHQHKNQQGSSVDGVVVLPAQAGGGARAGPAAGAGGCGRGGPPRLHAQCRAARRSVQWGGGLDFLSLLGCGVWGMCGGMYCQPQQQQRGVGRSI